MFKGIEAIRWKETIGGNLYRDNNEHKKISIIAESLLTVTCLFIFMLSSRLMIKDVFEWGDFSASSIVIAFILLVTVCVVMEISYFLKKNKGLLIRYGVLVVGILVAFLYLFMDGEAVIISGLDRISYQYMRYWNQYYGFSTTNFITNIHNVESALNFLLLFIFFVGLWISRMTKRNIIMMAIPISVLCLELLVGKSPGESGIFLLFVGALLVNASSWVRSDFMLSFDKRRKQVGILKYFMWVAVGVVAIVFYGVIKLVCSESADEMAGNGKAFKEFQQELVSDISNWSFWEMFGVESDSGIIGGDWGTNDSYKDKLTNKPLKYDNSTILKLELDRKPYNNIYLRGYYADTYEDGTWELNSDDFDAVCKEHGSDARTMGYKIMNLAVSKFENKIPDTQWYKGKITYCEAGGERAFFPYFNFISLSDGNVYLEGDGRYKKEKGVDELSLFMWDKEVFYEYYLLGIDDFVKFDWEKWYEDYVLEHYTQVPNKMPMVDEVASYVSDEMKEYSIVYDDENEKRLETAQTLVKWLEKNTRYTKQPQALPSGVDPVEYFLGESHEGYCMHYASSAVLVLRKLGVPARYATGYIVDSGSFKDVALGYQANIMDSRAHAWVEIYLGGIGWVPVEVTKGYDTTDLRHLGQDDEEISSEDTENSSDEVTLPSDEETSGEDITTMPIGNVTSEKSTDEREDGNKSLASQGGAFKIIIICIIVASASMAIVYSTMKKRMLYKEKLLIEIKRKRTVRAIKNINRRIYRKVRIDAKIFKSNLTDEEYAEALKKTYTDITEKEWARFMVVVKAATFSDIELEEKEMDFCYDIYKKVINKK